MKKNTKRSLLLSVLALILCCALLAGTTLAWFTDTASSGVNKIQAGNLDIEVQYKKAGEADFKNIEGTESLFSNNLWEPGHTEYVYLKVSNAGSLALKYKVMVTPVTEKGGVNVKGESFKLSDYLMFGTTTPNTSFTAFADRDAARRAVTATEKGLKQGDLTQPQIIEAEGGDQYLTLVVYMPENVGNEANYKTGTAAPTIELGIQVVATQKESENDSFGNTYDKDAVNDPVYVAGPTYDYFPQSVKTVSVAESGNTVITATGKLNSTDTDDITLAKVTVPKAAVANGVNELTVSVKPVAATNSNAVNTIQAETAAGRETANFDIKVEGIAEGNAEDINVEVFVGKGLANVKAYHNGTVIPGATYDPATGIVKFTTTSFSDFTVAYDAAVAAIGTKTYGSLQNAFAAVNSGETIILLKNSAGNGIVVPSGSDFTVDFNGYTYDVNGELVGSSGTETNGLQLLKDSTITFKNGTITSNKAKLLIQNYSNLTLESMNLDGSKLLGRMPYTLSNNNGNVVIKNTTITAASDKVAFDVCRYSSYVGPSVTVEGNSVINGNVEISSSGAKEGAVHALNVTGGIFNGKIYIDGKAPDFVRNITGGKFSSDPNEFCAAGKCALKNGDWYEIVEGTRADNQTGLNQAITGGANKIYLGAGRFDIPELTNRQVTVIGCGDQTIVDASGTKAYHGSTVTIKNCAVEAASSNYQGFQHIDTLTYEDCKVTGLQFLYGNKAKFKNCEFTSGDNAYSQWTYACLDVEYIGCKFNSANKSKSILCFNEGSFGTLKRTFTDCTFVATGTSGKSAVMINPTENGNVNTYDVTFNNCSATGYAENGISGQTIVGLKPTEPVKDTITVTINDEVVYTNSAT